MSDSFSNIENYFSGMLSAIEKEAFEKQCETDPAFAEEVAFYISMRDGLRQELNEQRRKEFAELYTQLSVQQKPAKKSMVARLLPYAAAACLLLVLSGILFFQEPSPQTIANRYIDNNLKTLSVPMSSTTDSLQMGIAAYNSKDYVGAERIFQALSSQPVASAEATKHLGIVYLVTEKYEQALVQFDALAQQTQLYANPGLFYKALVLLKRSTGTDKAEAKKILEEVVTKNLSGKKEAEDWIRKI